MMRHLSEAELVDLLDGTLADARVRHVETCGRCQEQSDALRRVLRRTSESRDDVPEPSPLFWEHLTQRVHDAVRREQAPAPASWLRSPVLGWAAACLIVAGAAAAFFRNAAPQSNPSPAAADARVQPAATALADVSSPAFGDVDDDMDWALVRIAADGLQWEDAPAAGIDAAPGSADHVALEMSSAERQELARLIEDAIKRAGA
jgi:hypothetical protein